MKSWIKDKLGILTLESENEKLKRELAELEQKFYDVAHRVDSTCAIVQEHTRCDADIDINGGSWVVLSGIWRGRGFVKAYRIGERDINEVKHHLDAIQKDYGRGQYDIAPQFKGFFDL